MRRTLALAALALALPACSREPRAALRTEPVTRGDVAEVVTATGEVSALVTVNVGSQVSGTIARLHADFNTAVRRGQLLAEIDPRLFEAAQARAAAALAAADADAQRARVALVDARRSEARTAQLLARSLVARAEMDAAETAREAAEAALAAAQAHVVQARADRDAAATNVALSRIRSPIDGVVISRAIDVGQTVAASLQAPTLFVIANDLRRMQILANVDEADVGKVTPGLAARFTVEAFPGEPFEGRIRDLRQAPSTIQNVVTYAAVIEAPNPDGKLRQGMTAAVSVVTRERAGVLRLPNAALRFRPAAERGDEHGDARLAAVALARADEPVPEPERRAGVRRATVYRLVDGRAAPVSVLLGISDGHRTEVLAGLSEGDQVVVGEAGAPAAGGKRGLF